MSGAQRSAAQGEACGPWDGDYLGNLDVERSRQVQALEEHSAHIRGWFRQVFLESVEGRRVFMVLAGYTHLLSTTFTGNSVSYLNEGKRDVMLFILEMCGVRSLEAVALIMKSAVEAQKELEHD